MVVQYEGYGIRIFARDNINHLPIFFGTCPVHGSVRRRLRCILLRCSRLDRTARPSKIEIHVVVIIIILLIHLLLTDFFSL